MAVATNGRLTNVQAINSSQAAPNTYVGVYWDQNSHDLDFDNVSAYDTSATPTTRFGFLDNVLNIGVPSNVRYKNCFGQGIAGILAPAFAVPNMGTWKIGHQIQNLAPSAGGYMGYTCITGGEAVKEAWVTGHVYAATNRVSNAGKIYVTAAGGTAGATAPTHTNGTVSDGGVSWTFVTTATVAVFKGFGLIQA
jgi:hypothetical protein